MAIGALQAGTLLIIAAVDHSDYGFPGAHMGVLVFVGYLALTPFAMAGVVWLLSTYMPMGPRVAWATIAALVSIPVTLLMCALLGTACAAVTAVWRGGW